MKEGVSCKVIGSSRATPESGKAARNERSLMFNTEEHVLLHLKVPVRELLLLRSRRVWHPLRRTRPGLIHERNCTRIGNATLARIARVKKKHSKPKRERFAPTEILKLLPGVRYMTALPGARSFYTKST